MRRLHLRLGPLLLAAFSGSALVLACRETTPDASTIEPSHGLGPLVVRRLDGTPVGPLAELSPRAAKNGEAPPGVCLLFLAPDCPIANVYAPEFERLHKAYAPRRLPIYAVYADETFSLEEIRAHRDGFSLTLPALLDPEGKLVRAAGASVTPEAAVWDAEGRLVYCGRIDDLYVDFGKRRVAASEHDLRDVLDALLAGQRLEASRTRAVGCFLPDYPSTEGSAESSDDA